MVSYYNPMAMYRQQGPMGQSGQFANAGSTAGWYSGYHPSQMPTPQQYLSCMQDSEAQQMTWHHPHGHSVFNPDFFEYGPYFQQGQQPMSSHGAQMHHGQQQPKLEVEPQLPSPPMSSSELSSPGGPGGGSLTPPSQQTRPGPVRSPYDWMTKPSYQSQPNPEIGTISSAPMLLDFAPQDPSGKTRTKDKYRVVYTDHQRLELEKEFHFSRYITIRRKAELAASLGLSERQVKIWFQNRRAKERKQVKKREELNSKDILHTSAAVAAMQLHHHQQSLLHHQHHQQQQHQHHQQHGQQQVATSVTPVAVVHHQTQLNGTGGTVPPALM